MDFRDYGFNMDDDTMASLNETADMLAKMFGVDLDTAATEKTKPAAQRDFGAEMDEAMKSLTAAESDADMERAFARIRQIKSDLREAQAENDANSRKLDEALKLAHVQWEFTKTFYPAQTACLMKDKNFDEETYCRHLADSFVTELDKVEKLTVGFNEFTESLKSKTATARDKVTETGSDALDRFAKMFR